jgi:hypothetical protein
MMKTLAGGIVLAALIGPAMANDYWIVQDPSNLKCSIVETTSKDTSKEAPHNAAIAAPFQSRAEAENSMDRMRKCGGAE